MNFSQALEALKLGNKLTREGWNGKDMYAVLMKGYPDGIPINKATAEAHNIPEGTILKFRPYFALKTAQDDIAHWVPSGSDLLAEDWITIDA